MAQVVMLTSILLTGPDHLLCVNVGCHNRLVEIYNDISITIIDTLRVNFEMTLAKLKESCMKMMKAIKEREVALEELR